MADTLETRSSSNNGGKLSENTAESAITASRGTPEPEIEEIYPPAREVIPILLAVASSIFLVSLVSSLSLPHNIISY
jgi:hypothetical protein